MVFWCVEGNFKKVYWYGRTTIKKNAWYYYQRCIHIRNNYEKDKDHHNAPHQHNSISQDPPHQQTSVAQYPPLGACEDNKHRGISIRGSE